MEPPHDVEPMRRQLAAAARRLAATRRRRDRLIREATAMGMSRREVGDAVGLTPAGVQHVLKRGEAG